MIFITIEKFRNELLNCDYSFAKQPIELLNIRHSDPFRSGFNFSGVDFNEVKLFERKLNKNQQYTFELIVNIGNILGLCVGFSVLKIYELVYFLVSYKFENKITNKSSKY